MTTQATNPFCSRLPSAVDPAPDAVAIDYSAADQELAVHSRALYIDTTGDLDVVMSSGAEITFANLPVGLVLAISVKTIKGTSTAGGVVLL